MVKSAGPRGVGSDGLARLLPVRRIETELRAQLAGRIKQHPLAAPAGTAICAFTTT